MTATLHPRSRRPTDVVDRGIRRVRRISIRSTGARRQEVSQRIARAAGVAASVGHDTVAAVTHRRRRGRRVPVVIGAVLTLGLLGLATWWVLRAGSWLATLAGVDDESDERSAGAETAEDRSADAEAVMRSAGEGMGTARATPAASGVADSTAAAAFTLPPDGGPAEPADLAAAEALGATA